MDLKRPFDFILIVVHLLGASVFPLHRSLPTALRYFGFHQWRKRFVNRFPHKDGKEISDNLSNNRNRKKTTNVTNTYRQLMPLIRAIVDSRLVIPCAILTAISKIVIPPQKLVIPAKKLLRFR
jgi:hypothetical protein